jgi:type I restriction enzyme S subunit
MTDGLDLPDLPDGWVWTRIGEIFEVETGSTPRTDVPEYWDEGNIRWITPKDLGKVNSIYINDTERKITDKGLRSCSAKIIPPNSIIISTRAPIGYIAILAEAMAFIVPDRYNFLSSQHDPRWHQKFLYPPLSKT